MIRSMCSWFLGLGIGVALVCCAEASAVEPPSFDLSGVSVSQAVALYYKEVAQGPYVVCGDVLADTRLVSLRASGRVLDGPAMDAFLAAYGYEAVKRDGVTVVCKKGPGVQQPTSGEPFLYRAKHRDVGYLVDLLSPMVTGTFANRRHASSAPMVGDTVGPAPVAQPGAAPASQIAVQASGWSSQSDATDDYLVFSGAKSEVRKLQALLDQIDVPTGEVVVKAYMYEVGKSSSDASALQMFVQALGSRLQVSTVGDVVGNLVRLKTGSVDLVASALASDTRFKVVSNPFVRLRSGKTARFVSGGQASILGAITTNQNGSTQQSYDRVESGTILEVSPVVRGETVDVDLFQQVSSFVNAPGASAGQPPVLNKRELKTSLSMHDGEVVVLAGLNDSKDDSGENGLRFLPFSLSKSKASTSSELVLVLEMKRL